MLGTQGVPEWVDNITEIDRVDFLEQKCFLPKIRVSILLSRKLNKIVLKRFHQQHEKINKTL